MTHRRSRLSVVLLSACLLAMVCTGTLLLTRALNAQARAVGPAHATKPYAVKIVNQDFGSDGASGSFSAKLGPGAQLVAGLASLATGIPYADIAKGGTFRAKIAPSSQDGLALVTFKDHALGVACVRWSGSSGRYDPSKGYLPVNGALTVVGGTGAAAHWSGSLPFTQTGLTGRDTLEFDALPKATTGAGRGLTTACKAVAALKR
jgi:hypothetical protein